MGQTDNALRGVVDQGQEQKQKSKQQISAISSWLYSVFWAPKLEYVQQNEQKCRLKMQVMLVQNKIKYILVKYNYEKFSICEQCFQKTQRIVN